MSIINTTNMLTTNTTSISSTNNNNTTNILSTNPINNPSSFNKNKKINDSSNQIKPSNQTLKNNFNPSFQIELKKQKDLIERLSKELIKEEEKLDLMIFNHLELGAQDFNSISTIKI
ncbi:hypothetical protein DFH28DRAFT_950259 [Melampsora americana]|nr:hypothetical protein DFH28DRAFT_950259 [Melampsora americana]